LLFNFGLEQGMEIAYENSLEEKEKLGLETTQKDEKEERTRFKKLLMW